MRDPKLPFQSPSLSRRGVVKGLIAAPAVMALSPLSAQARPVVVYTAFADSINALAPVFRQRTNIEVQVVAAGSGELVRRVRAESARPLGDCVVSIGGESIDTNKELFARHAVKDDAKILPIIKVSENWIPFSVTLATVVAVNTRLVPEAETPTSWADLADPKWKGRLAFAGADRSGSALLQMMQIIHTAGDEAKGWALFERMFPNFVVTGSSSAVPRGVAQGEYAVGMTLEDNAQRFIDGGSPVKIVYPKEGISYAADAMALISNGPNPEGARAFLDFVASEEGQKIIVEKFGRRPIRGDVAGPAKAIPAAQLPVNNAPQAWLEANSKAYLDRYLRLARR
jgi:iron(III) transport system substrate-binding protein